MACPFCDWRRNVVVALLVLPALAVPVADAEIYKCVAKDGSPKYQNFPCDIDSLGLPSNPSVAKAPHNAGVAGPPATLVNAAATKLPQIGELRIGMTSDDLRALLGEPEEMVDDEPAEGGRVSVWRYADGRTVRLDHKHRVMAVTR